MVSTTAELRAAISATNTVACRDTNGAATVKRIDIWPGTYRMISTAQTRMTMGFGPISGALWSATTPAMVSDGTEPLAFSVMIEFSGCSVDIRNAAPERGPVILDAELEMGVVAVTEQGYPARTPSVTARFWDITFTRGRDLNGAALLVEKGVRVEAYRCHFTDSIAQYHNSPSSMHGSGGGVAVMDFQVGHAASNLLAHSLSQ